MPPPTAALSPITVPVAPCRITRKTKGTFTSKRFQDKIYGPHGAQAFISTLPVPTRYETDSSLSYLADIHTHYAT